VIDTFEYTGELHGPLSQCAACGRTFLNLTAFDKHHDVDYTRIPAVRCIDPIEINLVQDEHGLWGTPEGHARRAADADRLRAQRAATAQNTGQ